MKLPAITVNRYRVTTDPLRSERKIELAALLLALVLCLQLLYSGARLLMLSGPSAIAPAADALNVRQIHAAAGVTQEQRGEIVARPLFWQGRRPLEESLVVAPEDAQEGKAGKLKGVRLLGVFGGGDTAGIIVQVKDRQRRILVGEEVRGWTLDTVEPNRVVFTANGRTSTLDLQAGKIAAGDQSPAANTGGATAQAGGARNSGAEDELSLGGAGRR